MRLATLAAAFLMMTLSWGATVRADPGDLQPRRPDRLIVESADRVSDGRKLQTEAEETLRKAERQPVVVKEGTAAGRGDEAATGAGKTGRE
jgi:hypothetical protein